MSRGNKRKVPLRKCVVSNEQYPKQELVRLVRTKEQELFIDPTGRKNGRGAYIVLEPEVARDAKKRKALDQAFRMKVPDEFYDELIAYVDHQKARQELL